MISRSAAPSSRRNKRRLIIDVDSTEDPVRGTKRVQPLTVTSSRSQPSSILLHQHRWSLSARLRLGNAHPADASSILFASDQSLPILFEQFGFGDTAFAGPDLWVLRRPSYHYFIPSIDSIIRRSSRFGPVGLSYLAGVECVDLASAFFSPHYRILFAWTPQLAKGKRAIRFGWRYFLKLSKLVWLAYFLRVLTACLMIREISHFRSIFEPIWPGNAVRHRSG